MLIYKSWAKKITCFLVLAVLIMLLPATIRSLIGSFAIGWMLVDLVDKFIDN